MEELFFKPIALSVDDMDKFGKEKWKRKDLFNSIFG